MMALSLSRARCLFLFLSLSRSLFSLSMLLLAAYAVRPTISPTIVLGNLLNRLSFSKLVAVLPTYYCYSIEWYYIVIVSDLLSYIVICAFRSGPLPWCSSYVRHTIVADLIHLKVSYTSSLRAHTLVAGLIGPLSWCSSCGRCRQGSACECEAWKA
eukprot:08476_3